MAAVDRPPRRTPSSHAGPSTTSRSVWAWRRRSASSNEVRSSARRARPSASSN